MYKFEQQIRVMLQFRAMTAPVEVSVPFPVLRYLDQHADRRIAADGAVVYYPRDWASLGARRGASCREALLVAA